jgi:hypothetical protein
MGKRLTICVSNQKFNAFKVSLNHIINSIASCAANTNDCDARA